MNIIFRTGIAGLMVFFSACLTVEENYTFNNDGSGVLEFVVDLSEMASLIEREKQQSGEDVMADMSFEEGALMISSIEGIQFVRLLEEEEDYRVGMEVGFAHIQALNQALTLIFSGDSTEEASEFFTWEGNVLKLDHRRGNFYLGSQFLEDDELEQTAESILSRMKYKLSFEFPRPLKGVYSVVDIQKKGKRLRKIGLEAGFDELIKHHELLNVEMILP